MWVVLWIALAVVLIFCLMALIGAPFLPSRRRDVQRAFTNLYKLKSDDYVVDLGCGDGKVLKVVEEFGSQGTGVELNPLLYIFCKLRFSRSKKIRIHFADMFQAKFPDQTTVVYVFGVERDGDRLVKHVQKEANRLGRNLTIISLATPAKSLQPDKTYEAYYLYEIKANPQKQD